MNNKLSIIVPVYNTEKYIEKCLLSCVQQDIKPNEYEIIVVDDGSKDDSLKIVSKLASDYSNIKVISKLNGGASSARNAGLDIAQGKYIWFVDSDDWIETNCIKNLVSIMDEEVLDALQIGYYVVENENLSSLTIGFRGATSVLQPVEYVSPDMFIGGSCLTIFKREIAVINAIRFDEDICLAEDQLFFLSIFNYSKRVKRQDALVYYYRQHTGSQRINATEGQLYQSISKIATFRFRPTFGEYCEFMITIQCLVCLNLPRKNIFRLHSVMKHISIERQLAYKNTSWTDKRLLKYYSYFGLLFLISFGCIRSFHRVIKSLQL